MNKFWAILIDSLYESWNSKIFQILLGLVALLLLLVLSISYESPGYEKGVREILKDFLRGAELTQLKTEPVDNFDVSIKAELVFERPQEYLEGLARTRASLWLEERRMPQGWVKMIFETKGEGEALAGTLKIANSFRESEILHTIVVDRNNAGSILLEDLKTMLGRRQIKDPSITIVREEGWRKQIEIAGSTSAFHIAGSCRVSFLFGALGDEFEGVGVARVVYVIQDLLFDWVAGVFGVFLAIIACAGFVPTMLQKGSIEMWLSRPLGRAALLTYKYVGAIMYVLPLAVLLFGGSFLIMSLKTGFWNFWFLLSIPGVLAAFAVLQSISTLVGVLWRNQLVSILMTMFAWMFSWMVYRFYFSPVSRELLPDWGIDMVRWLHFVSPRVSEIGNAALRMMYEGVGLTPEGMKTAGLLPTSSAVELTAVTLGFIAILHSLSCWIFVRRDH